jgi:hypothetical protein
MYLKSKTERILAIKPKKIILLTHVHINLNAIITAKNIGQI